MTDAAQKGLMRKLVDAMKAGAGYFRKPNPLYEPPGKARIYSVSFQENPDRYRYLTSENSLQRELGDAVRERNLTKVQEAINRGARVNDIVPEKIVTVKSGLPPPRGGIKDVVYFMTPLRLAHKLGFDDIAELLRKNGANA